MGKKLIKLIMLTLITICVFVICGLLFLRIKKPDTLQNILPNVSYIMKDYNLIKNYKEYKKIEEKQEEIYKSYRIFTDKNAKKPLNLGSGLFYNQGVHPDIIKIKEKNKDVYYMAYTPYPFGRDKYENPFIVKSENGLDFYKEKNVKNPLVSTPDDYNDGGHLSDTDIVYNNGVFNIYYAYNKKGALGGTKFYVITSKDGVNWTSPKVIYDTREGYSPTIVKDTNDFKMWHVESEGNLVRSTSSDGYSWTTFQKCNIDLGDWLVWHIDIEKTDLGYEGLVCARNPKLKTRALFYIVSKDGINFKASEKPILFPSKNGWDKSEIYRSTFLKENGKYRVWYSARGNFYKWNIGYTEYTYDEINKLNLR